MNKAQKRHGRINEVVEKDRVLAFKLLLLLFIFFLIPWMVARELIILGTRKFKRLTDLKFEQGRTLGIFIPLSSIMLRAPAIEIPFLKMSETLMDILITRKV
jgi:hypothetical protein